MKETCSSNLTGDKMTVRKPETFKHFLDLGIDGIRRVLKVLQCGRGN